MRVLFGRDSKRRSPSRRDGILEGFVGGQRAVGPVAPRLKRIVAQQTRHPLARRRRGKMAFSFSNRCEIDLPERFRLAVLSRDSDRRRIAGCWLMALRGQLGGSVGERAGYAHPCKHKG